MAKKVTEIPVEINELALSLLGWEVQDFRARVTTEQFWSDGNCYHNLAVSGVFRFNDADWVDCFSLSRDYPPHPIMLLSSPSISSRPAICRLTAGAINKGRPVRVANDASFINTSRPIDHADLRIELTAYDSVDSWSGISDIPLQAKEIPIELIDESSPSSVRPTFDQIEAFTHRKYGDQDDARRGLIRAAGRVTFGTPEELLADLVSTWRQPPGTAPTVADEAPFSLRTPRLMFDVLDDTGFLLDQIRGDIDITVHVDERGHGPSRAPRWVLDLQFDPDNYSAPPSRIVGRIEDN